MKESTYEDCLRTYSIEGLKTLKFAHLELVERIDKIIREKEQIEK